MTEDFEEEVDEELDEESEDENTSEDYQTYASLDQVKDLEKMGLTSDFNFWEATS